MREWMSDRRGVILLAGTLFAATIVVGVVWGVADAGGAGVAAATTTTVPEVESTSTSQAGSTTTTLLSTTSSLADPGSTTTSGGRGTSGSGSGGGSGGGSNPTTPVNQPPVIEEPEVTSDGMRLRVVALITDPDSETVNVRIDAEPGDVSACEGCPTGQFDPEFVYIASRDGYAFDVVVSIQVTDDAGNEVVETFAHRVEAVTTVDLRANFNMTGVTACFSDKAAVRLTGEIESRGPIDATFDVPEELRPDRTRIVILETSEQIIGARPDPLSVSFDATLDGVADSDERTFTRSDQVLTNLFSGQSCRGSLIWTVGFTTR